MTDTIKASPSKLTGGSSQYGSHAQKITSVGQGVDQVTRSVIYGTDGSLWGDFPQSLSTTHQKLQTSLECAGENLKAISSQLTRSSNGFSRLDATLTATFQDLADKAPLYTGYTKDTAGFMPLVPCFSNPFAPPPSSHSKSSLPGWLKVGGTILLGAGMVASAFFPPAWEDEPVLGAGIAGLDGTEVVVAGTEGTIAAGGALDGSSLVIDTAGLSETDAQLLSSINTVDDFLSTQTVGVP